jgi:hypothetical protein
MGAEEVAELEELEAGVEEVDPDGAAAVLEPPPSPEEAPPDPSPELPGFALAVTPDSAEDPDGSALGLSPPLKSVTYQPEPLS